MIAEHPDYAKIAKRLRFARENFEGSGGYASYMEDVAVYDTQPDDLKEGTYQMDEAARTHLFRHPREQKKFHRRVIMSYLTNVIKRGLSMLIGYLTKQQPQYDEYPTEVKDWMSRVNSAGDNWEQFKEAEILIPACYYGYLPVLFYYPQTKDPETGEDIETEAQRPEDAGLTVEVINPECIIDWRLRPDGSYEWLKVKGKVDITGPLDDSHKTMDVYTWYTQGGWWSVLDNNSAQSLNVTASGPYRNGLPVVVWRLRGGAITSDADGVQRELFNISSLIQEQERGTAFAMLSAPESASKDRVKTGSTDNVFYFSDDAKHRPEWMAPPPDVLAHLMAKREALIGEILESMGLDFDAGGGQTGMAFQFKMSKIVRLLQGIANSFSRGETGSLARVALELNAPLDDDVRCIWPSEFDAKDVEKEMDGYQVVLDRSLSTSGKAEADYRINTAAMSDMDEAKRTTIRKEAEEGWKQRAIDEDNRGELEMQAAKAELEGDDDDIDDEDADDLQSDGGAR
jgi:hypothetical protein